MHEYGSKNQLTCAWTGFQAADQRLIMPWELYSKTAATGWASVLFASGDLASRSTDSCPAAAVNRDARCTAVHSNKVADIF